jgi:uncharacterized membrane protein SirB2
MKTLVFFMGISNLLLAFQNNMRHIISTSKSTPKVSPTIMSLFIRLGMILVMKKINSINQKNNIRMFTTSIFFFKKYQILAKTLHPLSNT